MSNYLRYRFAGGCYFFTVNLLERKNTLLVDHIDLLRESVRICKQKRPFHIDAWVVLPEHMHCIWTLPEGDIDFSNRWKIIKPIFQKLCLRKPPYVNIQERGVEKLCIFPHPNPLPLERA